MSSRDEVLPPPSPDIDEQIVDLDPGGDAANQVRRRLLLRRFWQSAAGYWRKEGGALAWVLPAVILGTILLNLAAAYGMNIWNRAIFDALEKHDAGTVLFLSLIYFRLSRFMPA
jgi:putative ATP-binding cassette transporter